MELIMKTDFKAFPKAIEYNHYELKKQLAEELDKYNGIIVTEDAIDLAKRDRAKLNKFKEALDTERKEIKKQYLQPYEVFERNIKEIIGMVEEPIKAIDTQIKVFENEIKEKKKKEIEKFYLDEVGDLKGLVPLNKLWNQKWLNSTYKLSDIGLEMEVAVNRIKSGLQIIKDLHCVFEDQIIDKFIETLDINTALAENKRLEQQKKKLEALEQNAPKQEESKGRTKTKEETVLREEANKQPPLLVQKVICLDFRVFVTPDQMELLKNFLATHEIKYGRVPQAV